ncbi:MAG: excinuclease ABC subunit A [Woeseiaceae bacterium]|jgi:excinuclease ABC subunit A|tara:strand:- start:3336 stop:6176 length:2841 start_codon:yes stop_codon:yes gene_type:complete
MKSIDIRGARTHNLKNIDLDIPRDKLIVITGLSGSGKSSLAFDTIYAEGRRRYVESLSTYARQFLSVMEKPDVDHIHGLSPAISIEQKSTSHNPRSTVGTVTEIYDYLRLLFARAGTPYCPSHKVKLEAQTVSEMVDKVLSFPEGEPLLMLAPVVINRKGEHLQLMKNFQTQGFIRARINGEIYELDDPPNLELNQKHTIEIVIDRFKVRPEMKLRLAESFEMSLKIADGVTYIASLEKDKEKEIVFSDRYACNICGYSLTELEPRLFSFNNPNGACKACDGLGLKQFFDPKKVVVNEDLSLAGGAIRGWDRKTTYYFHMIQSIAKHYKFDIETPFNELDKNIQKIILHGSGNEKIEFTYQSFKNRKMKIQKNHSFEGIIPNLDRRYLETESNAVREELGKFLNSQTCPDCLGTRLNESARNVFVGDQNLPQISEMSVEYAKNYFKEIKMTGWRATIAEKITKEISSRLNFLSDVGLDYLSINRSADTLSGGEAQRIRLASQIGSGLVGVLYVLDEPSIGLHQRDNQRLLKTLTHLRDIGNTVIVVEHDEEAIMAADHVIDIGPGAGIHGGEIVASGTPEDIKNNEHSLTGNYLSGIKSIAVPKVRSVANFKRSITINGASGNNLKEVTVSIPMSLMTCVTGVSGSGKSTLINDTLYKSVADELNKSNRNPAPHKGIDGIENIDRVIDISQSPIGRTPRSNPATYSGLFTPIRELFAGTQEARSRGYLPGRFSFNVKGGRCEGCQGDGVIKVAMHFLPDVYVSCDVCHGKRYNRETLDTLYKSKNINEILKMTVEEASIFFTNIPVLAKKLQTLMDVGLSYIRLGQNATTLSGGEAQRIKLAKELSKRDTGNTLYILDEPTTGLHFQDISLLLKVLHRLRDKGNTIVVIEHNLDVIKTADWVIDIGPEGGEGGGNVIATGSPEDIVKIDSSFTGQFLKPLLKITET